MNKKKELDFDQDNFDELNNLCENCNREYVSVSQNLILYGFKVCESCRISKMIFPL